MEDDAPQATRMEAVSINCRVQMDFSEVMTSSLLTIADSLTCATLTYYHAMIVGITIREYRMMIVKQSSQGSPRRTVTLDVEQTTTDANGALMTKVYDDRGRLKDIIPPGSVIPVESYVYADYPVGSAYFNSVTKLVTNPDGSKMTATEYFDALGRTVRKESPGVGNNLIVETLEYNAKGQLVRKSNPYLETVETPVFTLTEYHAADGYVTKVTHPDGSYAVPTYDRFDELMQSYAADGSLISSVKLIKNAKGQVLSRTTDGKTLTYQYDGMGRLQTIRDPEGLPTTTTYDNAGRKVTQTDENSGTTTYTYDAMGNISTQKDALNRVTTFAYDALNRPTIVSYNNGEPSTLLNYDEATSNNFTKGRLTSLVDAAGSMKFDYDIRGNRVYQKRTIDDLEVIFRRSYDIQNRLEQTVYPDGTKVYQKYAATGHFSGITMDSADGSSNGYTVGKYTGPVVADGKFKIIRETGNGVKQEIEYDPIKKRPVGLVTKLANGHVENALSYKYDNRNNITEIDNAYSPARKQIFQYDADNRLKQANGKYGEEIYEYSAGGNLLKRQVKPDVKDSSTHRSFEYRYTDSKHKNAVTEVFSAQTGAFDYNYDEVGNMIQRNGDALKYDAQNKLIEMNTKGGDTMRYVYDSGGMRIKKSQKTSGVVVYSFDGLYEIARTPGQAEKHTLYFKGLYGDIFSQLTRNDAALLSELREPQLPNLADLSLSEKIGSLSEKIWSLSEKIGSLSEKIWSLSEVEVTYYKNKFNDYSHKAIVSAYNTVSRQESMYAMYGMFLLLGYAIYLLQQNKRLVFAPTPLLLLAYMIVFTDCGNFNSTKKGEAPWLLLASGINKDTPSVDDASNGASSASASGGGGTVSPVVPVTGMFFLHPDHLGSISMISDGFGNVISGGNNGGKSSINYKPYGEINRTDSSGPDITRFKYTGQEEDKETGLLYYKARYYDPALGRFLQADSVSEPEDSHGQNKYMYTYGNPIKYNDPSGHSICRNHATSLIGLMTTGNPLYMAATGVLPWHNYTGNGACSSLPQSRNNKNAYSLIMFTLWQQGGQDDKMILLGLAFYIQDALGAKEPTSDLDEASREHDVEGGRWHLASSRNANTKWIMRAWSFGPRWSRTYERELKRTPSEWGDARGTVAFLQAGARFTADLIPTIAGTLLFGTANILNEGYRINRSLTKSYLDFNQKNFARLGGEAKLDFKSPGKSYFRFNAPKCFICK